MATDDNRAENTYGSEDFSLPECEVSAGQVGSTPDENDLSRVKNIEAQLAKLRDYREKTEAFKRLAERNLTSLNLPSIEAPEGYRVNLDRLQKWAQMINPFILDDPFAKRVYVVSCCDLYFLAKKEAEFNAKLEELRAQLGEAEPKSN